jgi:tRNA(adenine34) deaminase
VIDAGAGGPSEPSAEGPYPGYLVQFEPAMRAALELAEQAAAGPARSADVPVGAVLLDPQGLIIARGRNRREADSDPTAHAEMLVMRHAAAARGSWRLDGCTLVVTLEPCAMCAGAVLAARLSRVVYGADDPRAGAAGSVWDLLHDRRLGPGVEVLRGVLAEEAAALIRAFFEARR